jgi:methionyl aminopeptidase
MITIKSESDIRLMREPCRIVKETLEFVGKNIRAGMTTKDVDDMVYKYITSCGAYPSELGYCGYPASSCVSVNEVVVHGIPSDRIIEDGDIVSVDITAEKNGFQGDAARTYLIGNVSEEKRKLVKVTEECFFKAIEDLKAGTPLFDIGYKVQTHAEAHGYGVVRALTGHGIGREMHEDPAVPNVGKQGTGMRLKAGMTICIEPMINMGTYKVIFNKKDGWTVTTADNKPAAHYENTVLIKEDGVEILTL